MISPAVVEWAAFSVGTVGTVLWAIGYKWRGKPLEAYFWLASSFLWIWFAVSFSHHGLMLRDLIGVSLYFLAIYRIHTIKSERTVFQQQPHPCGVCGGAGTHTLSGPGVSSCSCVRRMD